MSTCIQPFRVPQPSLIEPCCLADMAASPTDGAVKRNRLSADPAICVAALETVIEDWLEESRSRDATGLLKPLKSVTWKSAASGAVQGLACNACLFEQLCKIASNTLVPHSKLSRAFAAVHNRKPANFTAQNVEQWSDDCATTVRIGMSKVRELRDNSLMYDRAIRKARHMFIYLGRGPGFRGCSKLLFVCVLLAI